MKPLRLKKSPTSVKVTIIVFFALFALYACIKMYPIVWAFMNGFKTAENYFDDPIGLPEKFNFKNYINVFSDFRIRDFGYIDMLGNSLWILVANVAANVGSSALLAYPIARYRFPGRNFLYGVVIFANTIPIIGSGPASYKLSYQLGMINNPATIWIGWAVGFDFAFLVFYGTFKGIDMAYSEAAKIDGANNFTVWWRIILPQAMPCIVAIAITQAITVWNNYGYSMISLRDYPNLAYGLYLFDLQSNYVENSKPIFYAAAVISSIPVIILYSANIRLILSNVTAGGLKG